MSIGKKNIKKLKCLYIIASTIGVKSEKTIHMQCYCFGLINKQTKYVMYVLYRLNESE